MFVHKEVEISAIFVLDILILIHTIDSLEYKIKFTSGYYFQISDQVSIMFMR